MGTNTIVEPGQTLIVSFTLAFRAPAQIPTYIAHVLNVQTTDGSLHTLQVPTLAVNPAQPVVVASPLRGTNWLAGDAHTTERRSTMSMEVSMPRTGVRRWSTSARRFRPSATP